MEPVNLAVIGGSGVYNMETLQDVEEHNVHTPFGEPSDTIMVGTLGKHRVAFLARHGRGHRVSPAHLNNRANIYALKSLGVKHIISISACGSLREDFRPRDVVVPTQLFDRTRARPLSFFDVGLVVHISFAEPFCPWLSGILADAVAQTGATVHRVASFVVIDGPRFSTKAESRVFRQWGMDIVGMTAIPEAQLAREAEMCYATMAHVTDYDVWHQTADPVTAHAVIENLNANTAVAKLTIEIVADALPDAVDCACHHALQDAIFTNKASVPREVKDRLNLLVGKYLED